MNLLKFKDELRLMTTERMEETRRRITDIEESIRKNTAFLAERKKALVELQERLEWIDALKET